MSHQVELGESKARKRACLLLLLALSLIVSAIVNFGNTGVSAGARNSTWFVLVAAVALNLTRLPYALPGNPLGAILNDETTQMFRLRSLATGFWMSIVATLVIFIVTAFIPLSGMDVARIIVTTALVTSLVSFAVLELRACR